jgi:hypothetical protein
MNRLILALSAACLMSGPARAQLPHTPEADVVSEYLAALSARDVDRVLATLADTLELHLEGSDGRGGANLLEVTPQLRLRYSGLFERFPGARYELVDLISERELVVAKELVTIRGIGMVRITTYRVEGGRIRRLWVFASAAPALSAN